MLRASRGQLPRDRGTGGDERPQPCRHLVALASDRDEVGEERCRRLHECDAGPLDRVEAEIRVPGLLQDLGDAERQRDPHPVQEPGLVGERGGDVDDVLRAEPEVANVGSRRGRQRRVRVQDALRLAGAAGREQQLRRAVAGWPPRRDRVGVGHVALQWIVLADDDHVLEVSQGRLQAARHREVVVAAERVGDDQHPGGALAEHEMELALAEDRHQRLADGADPERREADCDEFEPIGKLVGDRIARRNPQLQQRRRGAVGSRVELGPGQLPALLAAAANS